MQSRRPMTRFFAARHRKTTKKPQSLSGLRLAYGIRTRKSMAKCELYARDRANKAERHDLDAYAE